MAASEKEVGNKPDATPVVEETEWWTDKDDPDKYWIKDGVGRHVEYKWFPVPNKEELTLWIRCPKENNREKAWRTAVEVDADFQALLKVRGLENIFENQKEQAQRKRQEAAAQGLLAWVAGPQEEIVQPAAAEDKSTSELAAAAATKRMQKMKEKEAEKAANPLTAVVEDEEDEEEPQAPPHTQVAPKAAFPQPADMPLGSALDRWGALSGEQPQTESCARQEEQPRRALSERSGPRMPAKPPPPPKSPAPSSGPGQQEERQGNSAVASAS